MSLPAATAFDQSPVTVTDGRMLHISGLSPHDKSHLRQLLTIPNPRRLQSLRFGGWVGRDCPKELTGYRDLEGDAMLVAPGAGAMVWRWLQATNRERKFQGVLRPSIPIDDMEYSGQGRQYQDPVVDAMAVRSNAVAIGPCGCGKTDMALRVMARRGGQWLIMVHMRKLRTQWAERIAARLGATVSLYSTTRKRRWDPEARFVIATVQALRRHPQDVVTLSGEHRGVWVDECHHTPSTTFTEVLSLGAWRYRYGVTATPERADGTTALMHWWIGPVVATVARASVEESGHLMRPRLIPVATDYEDTYNPDEPGDMQRLIGRLCDSQSRLITVCASIASLAHLNRHVLVCVDRISYGEQIEAWLRERHGIASELCHGKLPKSDQDYIIDRVAGGETRVLIATSLADEGLDLPILDAVVLATPSGSATRCEQRMGRACRPLAGKPEPVVVDIVDPLVRREAVDPATGETRVHRIFLNQFRRRYNAVYRKMTNRDEVAVKALLRGTPTHATRLILPAG